MTLGPVYDPLNGLLSSMVNNDTHFTLFHFQVILKTTNMTRKVEGGVYVLRFSSKTIKIGMGSNIERRLR